MADAIRVNTPLAHVDSSGRQTPMKTPVSRFLKKSGDQELDPEMSQLMQTTKEAAESRLSPPAPPCPSEDKMPSRLRRATPFVPPLSAFSEEGEG